MKFKLMTLIIIMASTFGLVSGIILSEDIVYGASNNNGKCTTTVFEKGQPEILSCGPDKNSIEAEKDQCKQTDSKCSSSQTGQGTFSNNPNKFDNGGGIFEKFTH